MSGRRRWAQRDSGYDIAVAVMSNHVSVGQVSISETGAIRFDDLGTEVAWASLGALSADYWRWQRLSNHEKEHDPMHAVSCVYAVIRAADPRSVDVLEALLGDAQTDQERCNIGAGPLEDLLSHAGRGRVFIDDVITRARDSTALQAALACVWLSDDVTADVRTKMSRATGYR